MGAANELLVHGTSRWLGATPAASRAVSEYHRNTAGDHGHGRDVPP